MAATAPASIAKRDARPLLSRTGARCAPSDLGGSARAGAAPSSPPRWRLPKALTGEKWSRLRASSPANVATTSRR